MKPGSNKALISIVIPFFNEEGNLEHLYSRVVKLFKEIDYEFELVLVDDGSVDRSFELAKNLRLHDSRVKILSFTRNFGHQIALSAGLDYAEGDAVILMDSDLQHPPEIIPEMLKKWKEGYENVYTFRKATTKLSFFKKIFTAIFYYVFRALTKVEVPVNSADFRLLDRKVVLLVRTIKERNRFLRGIISWTGSKSIGIEYQEAQRYSGKIKYNFKGMIFLAVDAIISFSSTPLYVGVFLGIIFAFLGFVYFGYVLQLYLFRHTAITGWSSLVSLVAILGGIQLIITGLIGIYVGRIFQEVKQRPLYLVRYAEGFNERLSEK